MLRKIFGTRNQRILKTIRKQVTLINAFEPTLKKCKDSELKAKTQQFRTRLQAGETLDDLLPEAFALVREASVRTLNLRHFDVQMIGGIVLHRGKIAEMRTGEGKTLVATLPAYLNALPRKGVHMVTVNDYLVRRDAMWMRPVFEFLDMSVGINVSGASQGEKQAAYAADITYGTNNEFGFDYLRDNMAFDPAAKVQRALSYAVVDEVDSILIDESRTPLLISGMAEQSSELYLAMDAIARQLHKQETEADVKDYTVDEKIQQVYLTEAGHLKVEELLGRAALLRAGKSLYDAGNIVLIHHLYAALRAHNLYRKDVNYIVKNKEVIIVDEHTGRLVPGRRWADGLHQATEAKEGVPIKSENQTLAAITFQNYFRLYKKLSGMTGTADTEAYEFQQIYGLEVVIIPTHRPVIRKDLPDQVYLNQKGKFEIIVADIQKRRKKGQPVLVGTASIESSEYLAMLLKKAGVPHQILNAKQHEREAKVIAEAGRPGNITIATNMAGRGTDIVLGGNLTSELLALEDTSAEEQAAHRKQWQTRHDAVIAAGGLHVLGTERNESRRIDNQLRGRSGRQGDPGSSQFYLSLEDHLMRIFAPKRIGQIMRRLGMKEHEVIENAIVTRSIENAQRKVEGHNFDIRKELLDFDNVANDQRQIIYAQRNELMAAQNIFETIEAIRKDVFQTVVDAFIPPNSLEEQWDISGLEKQLLQEFHLKLSLQPLLAEENTSVEVKLRDYIHDQAASYYSKKAQEIGKTTLQQIEKTVMLQSLDSHWREHLSMMDHLRRGIHLRGYAQKNPKQEYKREAFLMFTSLLQNVKREAIATLFTLGLEVEVDTAVLEADRKKELAVQNMRCLHAENHALTVGADDTLSQTSTSAPPLPKAQKPLARAQPKIGRNQVCFCGSGKKFKHCHGKLS